MQEWREAKQRAEESGDKTGLARAEQELKDFGTILDGLDLFKKNLQSFVRAYEFLSQIVEYDDPELEQLCIYAPHLQPLLHADRLDHDEIDVSDHEKLSMQVLESEGRGREFALLILQLLAGRRGSREGAVQL